MGCEYGAHSYLQEILSYSVQYREPLLRAGDIDLNPTLNHMRRNQRLWKMQGQLHANIYYLRNAPNNFGSISGLYL